MILADATNTSRMLALDRGKKKKKTVYRNCPSYHDGACSTSLFSGGPPVNCPHIKTVLKFSQTLQTH